MHRLTRRVVAAGAAMTLAALGTTAAQAHTVGEPGDETMLVHINDSEAGGSYHQTFELVYDLAGLPVFQQEVLHELVRVPYARTSTYGTLAARLGRPRAARAVGGALNRNPVPIVVPCHRIVGSTGNLVGYAGGLERKQALLELEGALLS